MGNIGAVFLFEWKRSLSVPRMAWWGVLAGFPVFIIGIIKFAIYKASQAQGFATQTPPELWVFFLFALVPMLVSMLGTMLWATPALSVELERRSWVYLAVRPNGAAAVMIGKYLATVTWVLPPALIGLTISVWLTNDFSFLEFNLTLWWAMVRLTCLSVPAYAAVYMLLGIILPRRAMVLAVAYSLIFELVVSFIPAMINMLTIRHRLQVLLMEWSGIQLPKDFMHFATMLNGNVSLTTHINVLLLYPPVLIGVAILILRTSEFSSASETDV